MRKYFAPIIGLAFVFALTCVSPAVHSRKPEQAHQPQSPAPLSAAADYTVNSLGDAPDADLEDGLCSSPDGACTLRAAIEQAAFELFSDETIGFSVTGTISLTGALPELSTNVTISGPGASLLFVRRETGGDYRIFTVRGGVTAAISGLTVSNGRPPAEEEFFSIGGGGGVLNMGTLTLTDCAVSGNFTTRQIGTSRFSDAIGAAGGGIHNKGTLTMTRCTVSENVTDFGTTDRGGFGGLDTPAGGGVYNAGTMTMTNCHVVDNRTREGGAGHVSGGDGGQGGGIFNAGLMTLTNCVVSRNRTGRGSGSLESFGHGTAGGGGAGGGIFNDSNLTVLNSTVSGNVTGDGSAAVAAAATAGPGGDGGGIYNNSGLTLTNCTVSENVTGRGGDGGGPSPDGNADGGDGGGIYSLFNLRMSHGTVAFNSTGRAGTASGRDGTGGGIYGAAHFRSSIVARNSTPAPVDGRDMSINTNSSGFNLVGIGDGACCFTGSDQVGTGGAPLDPDLGPLAGNGGPTPTHALLAGSPAVDKGRARDLDERPVTTDQRGRTRPFDDNATTPAAGGDDSDVGAFERQSAEPTPTPTPTPIPTPQPTPTPNPITTPTPAFLFFDSPTYSAAESCGIVEITLRRGGDVSGTTEVTYAVGNGTATQRGDFVMPPGRLTFAPGEWTKVIPILISEDAYAEPTEDVSVSLTHVAGARIERARPVRLEISDNDASDGASNPIDDPATFVCQHYHDFLNRQADPAGQAFWTNQIDSCGADAACVAERREDVSAAFFLSPEFQQTGYFVIRTYKAAFGDTPPNPRYVTLLADSQLIANGLIGGQPDFDERLEANKRRFLIDFVARHDFRPTATLGREAYVDKLFQNAGVTPTSAERNAARAAYGGGKRAERARALRSVIESRSVYNKLYNPAFVQAEYFGYLRRNANDAPDGDFRGHNFWLSKLNAFTRAGEDVTDESVALGRVRRAQMVKAFIASGEYRGRFHGDAKRGAP